MKRDLRTLLKESDPAGGDPGLSRADAARMRSAMLDEAGRAASGHGWFPVLAGGAAAAVALCFLLFGPLPDLTGPAGGASPAGLRRDAGNLGEPEARMRAAGSRQGARPPRRIQFITRGGTRVIWTLDPDFDV